MIEVEIMDDDAEPRHFSEAIIELRRKAVMQEKGNATLQVKTHLDDMVIISRGIHLKRDTQSLNGYK